MKNNGQVDIGKFFVFMAVIFIFVIITAIIIFWINTLQSALLPVAQGILDKDGTNNTSMTAYTNTIGQLGAEAQVMQWAVIAIIFTLLISILIGNLLAKNHPSILIPYAFISIIEIIFSVLISKEYGIILSDPVIGSTLTGFLGVTWFFGYLPIIITVTSLIGGLLMVLNLNRGISEFA